MPRRKKADPALATPLPDLDYNDPKTLAMLAGLELMQRTATADYAAHPWPFVRDCVQTLDEIDGLVKRSPQKAYVEYMVNAWFAHHLNAWMKSRRMWMSWALIACHYWLARFQPNSKIAFAAREEGQTEEEGSNELVKRAYFIHEHLLPILPPMEVDYCTGHLRFPNGSIILALPEGEHKARQHTFTAFMGDEVAHWRWARQTYIGLKPTIDGGGRITLVSSAAPGSFFQSICFDAIDRAA